MKLEGGGEINGGSDPSIIRFLSVSLFQIGHVSVPCPLPPPRFAGGLSPISGNTFLRAHLLSSPCPRDELPSIFGCLGGLLDSLPKPRVHAAPVPIGGSPSITFIQSPSPPPEGAEQRVINHHHPPAWSGRLGSYLHLLILDFFVHNFYLARLLLDGSH